MKFVKQIAVFILIFGLFQTGKYLYMKPRFSKGELATDFPINQNIRLSDLQGQYVLLDFWGSWCGPCMADLPALRGLHKKYNGKKFSDANGFEIVGVGVESDSKKWQSALNRLNLPWKYQTLDISTNLRFFNAPIANLYGVKEVPTKFLISPKGEIIGVNLPFLEVEKILSAKLQ